MIYLYPVVLARVSSIYPCFEECMQYSTFLDTPHMVYSLFNKSHFFFKFLLSQIVSTQKWVQRVKKQMSFVVCVDISFITFIILEILCLTIFRYPFIKFRTNAINILFFLQTFLFVKIHITSRVWSNKRAKLLQLVKSKLKLWINNTFIFSVQLCIEYDYLFWKQHMESKKRTHQSHLIYLYEILII